MAAAVKLQQYSYQVQSEARRLQVLEIVLDWQARAFQVLSRMSPNRVVVQG